MKTDGDGIFNRLAKYGIKPVKTLGQNFLIDKNIIDRILVASDISDADLVLEIGPGAGSLSGELAEKAGAYCGVEIDKKLIPLLEDMLEDRENTMILNKDILEVDIYDDILRNYPDYDSYKVVANLPYYITTPIIMKFLESEYPPSQMTVMMQKEVADRLRAEPGGKDYGSLTVSAGVFCDIEKVMDVSGNCFFPRPDVTSTVLKLTNKGKDILKGYDGKLFFSLVRSAFAQRRKKMSNSIVNASDIQITRAQIEDILTGMGIDSDIRAERMSLENFLEFSTRVERLLIN